MNDSFSTHPNRSPCVRSLIVGREREQALLRQVLDDMLAGHGALVLVSGEAGIGKTTLVDWLADEAEEMGCLVLSGRCYDLTTTPPYGPWRELHRSRMSSGNQSSIPSFDADPIAADALVSQDELVEQTWASLVAIADQQPLMIVLEDLHWSDVASLDLSRVIARRVRSERILLVTTYRSDELTRHHPLYPILPLLIRESSSRRIDVQPLSPEATSSLIAKRYSLEPWDHTRLVDWLYARAEGNPFFLEELLHELENRQLRQEQNCSWTLDELRAISVPPLLRQVIDARLVHLGDHAVELLGIGAVIGQQVSLELWATVTEASSDDLAQTVEKARASSIIADLADGSGWQFRHALIREALYEGIVSVNRRTWHRRVAEELAAGGHPDPDAVAHHFRQANDDRAVDWLIRAGERAASLYASKTAIERLEAALPALEKSGDDRRRGWVLWMLGEQLCFIDPSRATAHFDEAERLGSNIGDSLMIAYARIFRGLGVSFGRTSQSAGVADVTSGVDLLDLITGHPVEPPPIHAPNWSNPVIFHVFRALTLAVTGKLAAALDDIPEYVSGAADQELDRLLKTHVKMAGSVTQPMSNAYNALGRVRAMQGRTTEASKAFEKCTSLVAQTNDDGSHAIMCMNWLAYLVIPYFADNMELRRTLLERHDRAWEQAAEKFGAGSMPEGVSHFLTSYFDGAWSEMDWMQSWWYQRMATTMSPWGIVQHVPLGRRARARGDFERVWREVYDQLPHGPASEPGDCVFRGAEELQRLAIELALESGDRAGARDWLEAHDRWLDWSGAFTGRAEGELLWARYHLATGDQHDAREHVGKALTLASEPRQPLALLSIHRFLGTLDVADQRFAEAEQHLQESLQLAEACAAPFERALTLLELAELRFAQRQVKQTTTLLDEVQAICEPLGAKPTLERVKLLRDGLSQKSRQTPIYPAGLTQREVQVLRLVAEGLTDAQIAERLFLSRRTVSAHLRSVYNKIGIGSRTAAALFAVEHQLI